MKKFSHIAWYEWVLYALFSFFCVLLIYAAFVNLRKDRSPFEPIYVKFLITFLHTENLLTAGPALTGMCLLLAKKKTGWYLLFFGSFTFVFLPFVPVQNMASGYLPSPDYSVLFFLLIPLTLLLPKQRALYNINYKSLVFIFGSVFVALFLRFISFNIFFSILNK